MRVVSHAISASLIGCAGVATAPADTRPDPAPAVAQRVIRVAPDGSGDFTTPQAAIDAVADANAEPVVIHLAPGTYKQYLVVPKGKPFITLRGTDARSTILTNDRHVNSTHPDGRKLNSREFSSTLVLADDFAAEHVTFENSAGPIGQALAVFVAGDRATFRDCRFLGWQDTVRLNNGRSLFLDCFIEGHVDFIYGSGIAWFERCVIHCLRDGYITAASTPEAAPHGYVFNRCIVTADPSVRRTYLGRPWRPFASVLFMRCELPGAIDPSGWHNWGKPENEQTARYAEFQNTGPGADTSRRVAWSRQLSDAEAAGVTVEAVLGGADGWRPAGPARSPEAAPAAGRDR
jgi:pectinesterase